MVVLLCCVVSVKRFSGYYFACRGCMGKLRERKISDADNKRFYCFKCRQFYTDKEVNLRYCVVLSITDSSSIIDTIAFGDTVGNLVQSSVTEVHRYLEHVDVSSQTMLPDLLYMALVNFYVGKYFRFVFKSVRGPCSNLGDAIKQSRASQHDPNSLLVTGKMIPVPRNSSYDNLITILHQLCHKHSGKKFEGNDDAEHLLSTHSNSSSLYYEDSTDSQAPLVQLYSIDDSSLSNVAEDAVIGHSGDSNLSRLPSQEQRNIIEQLTNDDESNESVENEVVTELKTEWEELQDQSVSSTSSVLSPFWAQLPTQQHYLSLLSPDSETCPDKDDTPLLASCRESFTPELLHSLSHQSSHMPNNSTSSMAHSTDKLHYTPTGPRTLRRIELNYTSTPKSMDKNELCISIPFKTPIKLNNCDNACDSFSPDLFA